MHGLIRFEFAVSTLTLIRNLLIVAVILLICHGALTIYHYRVEELPWLLRQIFDVDEEQTLPTWFSAFLLFIASAFLWLCARGKRSGADPWAVYWYILAVGFLLMSVDEVAGIHETINSVIEAHWAVGGGILALVIGLCFVPFLLQLPRRTAILFLVAGVAYISGVIGIEILGQPMDADTLEYNLLTLVEEGLEMFGVILFLYGLLDHMHRLEPIRLIR